MKIECKNPEAVVKGAFWLAWQACGGPMGLGFLQDRPGASKGEVWAQVYNRGDYPGGNESGVNKPGEVYGDYVFGRMMKLSIRWDETSVTVADHQARPDYQAWCVKYPTYKALIEAAIRSVDKK